MAMLSSFRTTALCGLALVLLGAGGTYAGSLSDVLQNKTLVRLELAPLGPALASTVASTYPVASASSSFTYVYNPAFGTFERQTGVAGPIIGERAETIGRGQFNLTATYSYVRLTSINGDDLDDAITRYGARVAHVQIADAPGRGEPGTGHLDLNRYLHELDEQGYRGWVGLEYKPSAGDTEASLGWLPRERRAG